MKWMEDRRSEKDIYFKSYAINLIRKNTECLISELNFPSAPHAGNLIQSRIAYAEKWNEKTRNRFRKWFFYLSQYSIHSALSFIHFMSLNIPLYSQTDVYLYHTAHNETILLNWKANRMTDNRRKFEKWNIRDGKRMNDIIA